MTASRYSDRPAGRVRAHRTKRAHAALCLPATTRYLYPAPFCCTASFYTLPTPPAPTAYLAPATSTMLPDGHCYLRWRRTAGRRWRARQTLADMLHFRTARFCKGDTRWACCCYADDAVRCGDSPRRRAAPCALFPHYYRCDAFNRQTSRYANTIWTPPAMLP